MSKKKIFAWFSAVFLALLLYASFDIASRTTFPGSKPQLKERIEEQFGDEKSPVDSLKPDVDSLQNPATEKQFD